MSHSRSNSWSTVTVRETIDGGARDNNAFTSSAQEAERAWAQRRTGGISDPELVFYSHSFPPLMRESVLICLNSMDSIFEDKVLKRTQLDLQKRFPFAHIPNVGLPFSAAFQ